METRKCRRSVGLVVFYDDDFRFRKLVAQSEMEMRFRGFSNT